MHRAGAPTDGAPTDGAPTDGAPTDRAPTDGAPRRASSRVRVGIRVRTAVPTVLLVLLAALLPSAGFAADAGFAAHPGFAAHAVHAVTDPATQVAWGVRPADTVHGSDRPNFAYELPPGGTLTDALVVTNRGAAPLTLQVYAADGFLTDDGTLDLLPAGEPSTALGSWVAVAVPQLVVEPGASAEVPFTLTVPDDATPGDYAAGVVSTLLVENTEGVSVDRRLGSRMHLRVSGDLAPALAIDDVQVAYRGTLNPFEAGVAAVTFTVTNAGNTRVAPGEQVRVTGLFGLGDTRATQVGLPELLPGSSVVRTATVDGVWPLVRATARVAVGGEVVMLTAASQSAGQAGQTSPAVSAAVGTASAWAIPWVALAALLVLVMLAVLRVRAARRRSAAQQRTIDAAVAEALARRADA